MEKKKIEFIVNIDFTKFARNQMEAHHNKLTEIEFFKTYEKEVPKNHNLVNIVKEIGDNSVILKFIYE